MIILRTVDTDVLCMPLLSIVLQVDELRIAFGSDSHFCYIEAHGIVHGFGEARSRAL